MKQAANGLGAILRLLLAGGTLACFIYARGTDIPDPKLTPDAPSASSVEAPDPATPFLVGTGLVGVSLVVRRMRRKRED